MESAAPVVQVAFEAIEEARLRLEAAFEAETDGAAEAASETAVATLSREC